MTLSPLEKEEFIQSYLQYRWLDETRNKLIDRFFIIVLAVLGARFQFNEFFSNNPDWLLVLYLLVTLVATLMARSIVTFRRQQRGHGEFIKVMRERLLSETNANEFKVFKDYVRGKRVYLTRWTELITVLSAVSSPALFFDKALNIRRLINLGIGICVFIVVVLLILYFVAIPFWKYNYSEKIIWDKD